MAYPFKPLQTALYQRLSNDSELKKIITGIYDHVEVDIPFPYIIIGEPRIPTQEIVKFNNIYNCTVTLHTWFNQQTANRYGNTATYEILDAVHEALKIRLDVVGYKNVNAYMDSPKVLDDIDNILKHGILNYHITLQEI
ncbi:DUF3168 domain-containing protein [Lysinibacillus sp. SGAir0095]|uniref:DUF3168 domain-containing protein n=1 Tax=Lysinibacillus sp. SGAir0095 TaxID=2070463 RepID=UPI0010CCC04B|nr:DUF3168 domain-containing protein [Lysinibacillus sp. SGAir0095]QCR33126.1 hypothetical protein C1N55_13460 [Lysinibacillus sp. SGAir0095]